MAEPSMTTMCVVCSRVPTRTEPIRRHVGMIVMQRFVKLRQPLCRDHGIEITNTYLRKTLIEGWWGFVSFFVNFFAIGVDLVTLVRYRSLAEPQAAGFSPVSTSAPDPVPSAVAPGWYPDPAQRFEHRWHDGQRWTATVATGGQQHEDPLPGA